MRDLRLILFPVWVLSACQSYEFNRVEPFAISQSTDHRIVATRRLKPNMMLLVDNSFSMELPTNPLNPACPADCGKTQSTKCPTACPTRISELKQALGDFLANDGAVGRFGLTHFPQPLENQPCHAATNVDQRLPAPTRTDEGTEATLLAAASAVNSAVQGLVPNGGTPTAASLDFVGSLADLTDANDDRDDFVLLLTDGLPNCRDAHPENVCNCGATCSAARLSACACTQDNCQGARCNIGCLDDDGSVQAVKRLSLAGVRTAVIGFGADVNQGDGPAVLNALAEAGGFARRCDKGTDAECGAGNTCDVSTHLCSQRFYAAQDRATLGAALKAISDSIPGACERALPERPSRPEYLAVLVDGVTVQPGPETYEYDFAANLVTFVGALCTRLENSTAREPVDLEFRVVQRL